MVAPTSDVHGLAIRRDGVAVGRAEVGIPIPVDPGHHVVEASAPDKKPWSAEVDIGARNTDVLTVALEDAPKAAAPPPPEPVRASAPVEVPPPAPPSQGSGWKTAGIVTAAAGVVGLGLGAVFGVEAVSKNNQALQPANCPTSSACRPSGLALTNDAFTDATVSTIAFVAGGALVVGGAVLWLTSPSPRATGLRVVPQVGLSSGGVRVEGAW